MRKTALPLLPFGENIASVQECPSDFGAAIDKMFPGVEAYEPTTHVKDFRSRTATIALSNAVIVAASVSPTHVERKNNPVLTFMIPMAGAPDSTAKIGSEKIDWGMGRGGVFLPQADDRLIGSGGFRSHLMWSLDPAQLQNTAQAMLGIESAIDLQLERVRLLPQSIAGVKVDTSFSALFPLLNLYANQPDVLKQMGLEDVLYRQTVMLLRPDLFEGRSSLASSPENSAISRKRIVIERLCTYIQDHLGDQLNLTQLERVSGLSARTLQTTFAEVLGCTPMAWIKEQRLLKTRQNLLAKNTETSIEAIALGAGFQSMPSFFVAYRKRFKETPGQTRKTG